MRARAVVFFLLGLFAAVPAVRAQDVWDRLYGRPVTERELALGLAYLSGPDGGAKLTRWERYAQALLSANEFLYVD